MIDYGFNIKLTGSALKEMQKLEDSMRRVEELSRKISSISVKTNLSGGFLDKNKNSEKTYNSQKNLENKSFLMQLSNNQKIRQEEIKGVFKNQGFELKSAGTVEALKIKGENSLRLLQKNFENKSFLSQLSNNQKIRQEEIKGVFKNQGFELKSAGTVQALKIKGENSLRLLQEKGGLAQKNFENKSFLMQLSNSQKIRQEEIKGVFRNEALRIRSENLITRNRLRAENLVNRQNQKNIANLKQKALSYAAPNILTTKNAIIGGLASAGAFSIGQSIWDNGTFIQDAKLSLKSFLGSEKKAEELYKDVFDFSQKTPFTLQESLKGAMKLAPVMPQTEIIPTFKMLGTAAKGGMGDLNEIINNYVQGIYKRNIDLVDLKQYSNQMIPIRAQLEKMLSITKEYQQAGGFDKMVSKGMVGSKLVEMAFKAMTSEGGIFFNLLEERSKTASGQWSILQGKFQSIAGEFFLKILPFIEKLFEKIKYVADNSERLYPAFQKLGNVFTNTTFGKFFDLFGDFKKSSEGTSDIIDKISSSISVLSKILDGYINYVLPFQLLASSLTTIASILTLGGLVPLAKGLIPLISGGVAATTTATATSSLLGGAGALGTGSLIAASFGLGIGEMAVAAGLIGSAIYLLPGAISELADVIKKVTVEKKTTTLEDFKNQSYSGGLFDYKSLDSTIYGSGGIYNKKNNYSGRLIEFGNDGFPLYDKNKQEPYNNRVPVIDPSISKYILPSQNGELGGAGRSGGISGSTRNLTINFNDALVKFLIEKVTGNEIVEKTKESAKMAADELTTLLSNIALLTR